MITSSGRSLKRCEEVFDVDFITRFSSSILGCFIAVLELVSCALFSLLKDILKRKASLKGNLL